MDRAENTIRWTWPGSRRSDARHPPQGRLEGVNIVSVSWGDHLSSVRATGGSTRMRSCGAGCPCGATRTEQARSIGGCCARGFLERARRLRATVIRRRRPRVVSDGTTSRRSRAGPRGGPSPWLCVTVFDEVAVGIRARAPRQLSQRNAWAARRLAERLARDHPQWLVTDRRRTRAAGGRGVAVVSQGASRVHRSVDEPHCVDRFDPACSCASVLVAAG